MDAALRAIYTIWYRDLIRFLRERNRIIGMIGQPLMYLLIVGQGISAAMGFRGVPADLPVNYVQFMFPGILGMSVLFTSMFAGVSIIWDREFGFLKEVLVAPVPRWATALGKALGGGTVAIIQATILLLLAPFIKVSLSLWVAIQLLSTLFLISLGFTFLGIAVASRMDTLEGFQMIMNFLVMPLFFLSGAIFPMYNVPGWMNFLMSINPLTYGVDALRNLVFTGTEPGVSAFLVNHDFSFNIAIIIAMALFSGFVGSWSFSRQA